MPVIPLKPTNYYFSNALTVLTSAINTTASLLDTAKVILGQNAITPSLVTSYSDLNEANFTGYARSANITWGSLLNDADTTPSSQSQLVQFRCNLSNVANQIQSLAVTDGVAAPNTGILSSGSIAPPYPIANPGDGFGIVVTWNLGNVPGLMVATLIS